MTPDLTARALEAAQFQQARIAGMLGCSPLDVEREVERITATLPKCRDCQRITTNGAPICNECLERRR